MGKEKGNKMISLSCLLTYFLQIESSRHELRQAVPFTETVLQEGNHEEDGKKSETGVPVLSSLPSLNCQVERF